MPDSDALYPLPLTILTPAVLQLSAVSLWCALPMERLLRGSQQTLAAA